MRLCRTLRLPELHLHHWAALVAAVCLLGCMNAPIIHSARSDRVLTCCHSITDIHTLPPVACFFSQLLVSGHVSKASDVYAYGKCLQPLGRHPADSSAPSCPGPACVRPCCSMSMLLVFVLAHQANWVP